VQVRVWCFPLAEDQFRNAIQANYYQSQRMPDGPGQKLHFFQFELDHEQTHALMDMFTLSPSPNNFWTPPIAAAGHEHARESILLPVSVHAPEYEGNIDLNSERVVKSYADIVKKKQFEKIGTGDVNAEHANLSNALSNGFDDLDCGYTPLDADKVQQQQQSGQRDKETSFKWVLERVKELSRQQHNSDFCANATTTEGNDTYNSKDLKARCAILDGHPALPENLDDEVNQLSWGHSNSLIQSLDLESCTEAKVHKTNDCVPYYHHFLCLIIQSLIICLVLVYLY
jgi:hypothetical protein